MKKVKKYFVKVLGVLGAAVDFYGLGSLMNNYAYYLMKAIESMGPWAWSLFFTGFVLGFMDVLRGQLGARFNMSFAGSSLLVITVMLFQPYTLSIVGDLFVILIWTMIFTFYPWRRGPWPSSE